MATEQLWTGFDNTKIMAERAVCDEIGQNIVETYAPKSGVPSVYDGKLKLQLGSAQATNTGFSANANTDVTVTIPEMTGATASTAGESGLVPAPAAGDEEKLLTGDGNWTPLENDVFGTQLLDENDRPVLDETTQEPIYDAGATDQLWTGFSGKGFGAIRAYADQDGNNIKATYARKADLPDMDEAPESDIDNMFVIPNTVVIGGRRYRTVTIGNQEWLAEDLDYKFKVNGTDLPIGLNEEPNTPAAWYYNNDEAAYGIDGTYKCGLLYNWYALDYLETSKASLLPDGWHVPIIEEWEELYNYVVEQGDDASQLKAIDDSVTEGFPNNWNGTDKYGFSILPSGYKFGVFHFIGTEASYWSMSTYEADSSYAFMCDCYPEGSNLTFNGLGSKDCGAPIRLVRTIS